ncbi:MAG: hypothetical protein ACTHNS_02180 [Marmoricola sp.]
MASRSYGRPVTVGELDAAMRQHPSTDLHESQALYGSLGYSETAAHSGGPYSDRWYGKTLA